MKTTDVPFLSPKRGGQATTDAPTPGEPCPDPADPSDPQIIDSGPVVLHATTTGEQ